MRRAIVEVTDDELEALRWVLTRAKDRTLLLTGERGSLLHRLRDRMAAALDTIPAPGATETDEPAPDGTSVRGDGESGLSEAEKGQIPGFVGQPRHSWSEGSGAVWMVTEDEKGVLGLYCLSRTTRAGTPNSPLRWVEDGAPQAVLREMLALKAAGVEQAPRADQGVNPRRGLEGGSMHRNYLRDQDPAASVRFVDSSAAPKSSSTKKGPGLESPSPLTREEAVSQRMLAAQELYVACAAYVRALERDARELIVSGYRYRVLAASRKMEEATNESAGGAKDGIRCAGCRCEIPLTVYCDTCTERRS